MYNVKDYQTYNNFICIDLKSFYATVECVKRNLDPFKTALVVADKSRGDGSIVLAVTPYLKSLGVSSRCRIFDLPKDIQIIYAKPSMQTYINYSTEVINVYLDYVSKDDLYIYSIDEAFLDVTNYLKLYKLTDYELALKIINDISSRLELYAVAGVGPNMLLAKLSMDIEAKKTKNGVAKWTYDDVKDKLWPVTPLSKMWGIGRRMEHHLNVLGISSIYDIANYNPNFLKAKFGILGLELWFHANGIDASKVQDQGKLISKQKSLGVGQVLFKDYNKDEIYIILLEMVDDITRRMRIGKKACLTIHLGIGYSKDYGGGFSRQLKLDEPTQNASVIFKIILELFNYYYEDLPIRRVSLSLSNFVNPSAYQYSLFEDANLLDKEHVVAQVLDEIKVKFGKNSVNRTSSKFEHATAIKRNEQIGGHHV